MRVTIGGWQLRMIMLAAGVAVALLGVFEAPRGITAALGALLVIVSLLALWRRAAARVEPVVAPKPESFGERSARLLDGVPAPLIVVDRRAVVVAANAAARAGFPALKPDAPMSFAFRNPQLLSQLDHTIATGEPSALDLVEKVPIERSFQVRITALRARDDAAAGREAALISMQDTTAMRRTEQMRVDFIANASHELRTPLASIMGFVETLQGAARNDAEVRDRFLGIMAQQGRRMARLIEDLLSLSRIELSAHLQPEAEIELVELLHGVIDGLSALAYDRGVRLDFVAGSESRAIIRADRDELIRVFENLIENAIKYGQSGGRVEIAAGPQAERAGEFEVAIRDFGPGIAPEHLPRLTERFYRVDVASSRDKGGTGLGLAIVKHILNRHRGRLLIESRLGEGAVFRVQLPLRGDLDKTL